MKYATAVPRSIAWLAPALLVGVLVATARPAEDTAPHRVVPTAGFVPDAQTAKRIAEAVWVPIYGEESIQRKKPFEAVLQDGVWYVNGTLSGGRFVSGGVPYAEISRRDGRILRVSHDK